MEHYITGNNPNYPEIIALGEFVLQNTNINQIVDSTSNSTAEPKNNIKAILSMLLRSYSALRNRQGFDNTAKLLNQYFRNEPDVQRFINRYKF